MFRCRPGRRSPTSTTGSLPGVTQETTSQASASSRSARSTELGGQRLRRLGARVEADAGAVAGGGQAARRPGAVQAAADDAAVAALARERLRGHRRDGAGAQRGDRARVEQRERPAVLASLRQDHADDGRQAVRGLPGNEEIHLRIASPRRGPAWRGSRRAAGVEVDLGRHLPRRRAGGAGRPRAALDRLRGRDGGEDGVVGEDLQRGHEAAPMQLSSRSYRAAKSSLRGLPEEAAAVVAALERFMRETVRPPPRYCRP